MKNIFALFCLCLSLLLAGCIVDVAEQNTTRRSTSTGKGVTSIYFDASLYRESLDVLGSPTDTLIADGTFSLWSPGSSTASSIADDLTMYWKIDTLHHGELFTSAEGPQKELLSIDKMSATIPARVKLTVYTTSNDVTVKSMKGDLDITGANSNIDFQTDGRMIVKTTTGNITGSTGAGGSVEAGSGNIDITVPSGNFESIYAVDTTGNVKIHLAAGAPVTFRLQTSHGNIDLNYDGVQRSSVNAISVNVNGGGKIVSVSTDRGSINVSNK